MPSPYLAIRIAVRCLRDAELIRREYKDHENEEVRALNEKYRRAIANGDGLHDQLLRDSDALKDLKRDATHRKALKWLRFEYEDDYGPIQDWELTEPDYGPKDYKDLMK